MMAISDSDDLHVVKLSTLTMYFIFLFVMAVCVIFLLVTYFSS